MPYHWGRFVGITIREKLPPVEANVRRNVSFDTCVYHQPGIDLLTSVVAVGNILFASEMLGAVRGDNPRPAPSPGTTPSATSTRRSRPATSAPRSSS